MEPEIEIVHHRRTNVIQTSTGSINNSDDSLKSRDFAVKVSFWHQFWALLLKDFSLQIKSYVTNICQLLVPIIFISFAGIIQVVLNNLLHKNGAVVPGSDSLPIPFDVGRVIACNKSDFDRPNVCYDEVFNFLLELNEEWEFNEEWISILDHFNLTNVTDRLIDVIEILRDNGTIPSQQILFDLPFYYIGKHPSVDVSFGELLPNGSSNGFECNFALLLPPLRLYNFSLDFTINPNYKDRYFNEDLYEDGDNIQLPFFLPIPDNSTAALQKHLVSVIQEYNTLASLSSAANDQYDRIYEVCAQSQAQYNTTLGNVKNRKFNEVKPRGAIFINALNETDRSLNLDYTIIANELNLYSVRDLPAFKQFQNSSSDLQRRNTLMNMVHNGILKYYFNFSSLLDPDSVIIATYIMPFFPHPSNLTIDVTNLLGGVLYPFATSFIFPVFIAALVKDKFERHLIMMEQNGLNKMTYWTVTYIFNYTLYTVIAIVIAIFSLIWRVRLFTQTTPVLLVIILLLWGHSQVVLGFLFSNFFNSPRTSTIIGYIFVIAGVLVALSLELLQVLPEDKTPFPLYMMYPPFAFYRLLFYMIGACSSYQCYDINILSAKDGLNLVTTAILYLAGSTVLLMFVSVYLSYVLPSEYGVRKSPFFPIIAIYHGFLWLLKKAGLKRGCDSKEMLPVRSTVSRGNSLSVNIDDEVDEDVQQEEEMLSTEFNSLDAPVIIFQLRKEYPGSGGKPPHVAVHSFSLAVNRNECFGLLGPNGAGKTTLISVLTGLYEPTSGTAKIGGYDLATQMSDIHHHLGVCPQFDIQYPELTAEEHLLFYARLKGVKLGRAGRVVEKALRQVNLYDARKRKSKALSGGMRRRLSVAMACIGSPDILILDEPTTGLDPASRRQVWEVIEKVKDGRSVILTTHAMEEADHLCTRIGIMNYGRLRCLGSQTRLKTKFGSGYQLKFHCNPGKVGDVERFVQTNIRSVRHLETYADSCTYQMEKEDVIVSELFELLDSVQDQIGIVDWGIKMTTLEDVFLNIVKNNADTRTQVESSYCPAWIPCQCCYRSKSTE